MSILRVLPTTGWKTEVIDLMNAKYSQVFTAVDLALTPHPEATSTTADVAPAGNKYYSMTRANQVKFNKRDISKFFLGVPIKITVPDGTTSMTHLELITEIDGIYGLGMDLTPGVNFSQEFFDIVIDFTGDGEQEIELDILPTSAAWFGGVVAVVATSGLDVGHIIENRDLEGLIYPLGGKLLSSVVSANLADAINEEIQAQAANESVSDVNLAAINKIMKRQEATVLTSAKVMTHSTESTGVEHEILQSTYLEVTDAGKTWQMLLTRVTVES